jgi:3-methyladenine DNA glycosylase AlkD
MSARATVQSYFSKVTDHPYDEAVTTTWTKKVLIRTTSALEPLRDPETALAMAKYMKFVAPFLGVPTPPRRLALRERWRGLEVPTSDELGDACVALMNQEEREYHYAACELIARYLDTTDEFFLVEYVQELLTLKPWWDTVDCFGTSAVSPLCWRYDATDLVLNWSASNSTWLIRAAIQHQRGWKMNTDVDFVLSICDAHSTEKEFFIAKAIGWALRDISRFDAPAVQRFLQRHPNLSYVAVREARRGLGVQ